MIQRALLAFVMAVLVTACRPLGFGTPTSPSADPTSTSDVSLTGTDVSLTVTSVSLTGTVTAAGGWGAPVKGATVEVLDGVNKGFVTTTNSDGAYRFDALQVGDANISASAHEFPEAHAGVYIDGVNTLDFELNPPAWTARGTGSDVFIMPSWVARVRIAAIREGACGNFVVRVAGQPVVNITLGTCAAGIREYQGVHLLTGGGTVEVNDTSSAVSWSFEFLR